MIPTQTLGTPAVLSVCPWITFVACCYMLLLVSLNEIRQHFTKDWVRDKIMIAADIVLYAIGEASNTVIVNEALIPGQPPCLTQRSIGKYLQPLTRELSEVAPSPTIDELPDAVIEFMVKKDKAFWVDKPGANAYTLHDAYNQYGMTTEMFKPSTQAVFPRSYQYDLDCVKWRSRNACNPAVTQKPPAAHCRDCSALHKPAYTPFQLAWIQDTHQQRWRYYPDLTANLTPELIREQMTEVGRPFRHEACTWYNKNYPSSEYKIIMRKFSK